MNLDFYTIQARVRALANSMGLTVRMEDEHRPRTDGRTIWIGKPSPTWDNDRMIDWESTIYHEIGHVVEEMRDCFEMSKDKDLNMESFLGMLCNLLDDQRQEYFNHGMYVGRDNVMSEGKSIGMNRIIKKMIGKSEDKHMNALEAMMYLDAQYSSDYYPHMSGVAENLYRNLNTQGREMADILEPHKEELDPRDGTAWDEYEIALKVIRLLDFDEEKEKEDSKKGEGDGEGEEGEGKGKEGEGEGKGKGKGKGKKGDGKDEGDYGKYMIHNHSKAEDFTPGRQPDGSSYEYVEEDSTGSYIPRPPDEIDIPDLDSMPSDSYFEEQINDISAGKGLANQVRKLLQVRSQSFYQHGRKKGKIGKNLHRATLQNSGGYQQKIFKQRIENNMTDTVVQLVIDCSGSMGHTKFAHAAKAAQELSNVLDAIRIPTEIIGFTETARHLVHPVFKGFNEKVPENILVERFAKASNLQANNADGESILWAFNRIIKQPNKRKLMIVLSDGMPACYNRSGSISDFTKEVVGGIEKSPVEIYGIGIMDDSVKRYYKQNAVIHDAGDVESTLIKLLKDKIIGRG